ncbi:MAG: CotH kinase family protein [Anaeromassilibacillus sp.]|nr:CotH kinase family protein [Anaeromassilibacillus sp.]MDY3779134.1 CotH kinase family protein [Candidatus Limousia pullorum]
MSTHKHIDKICCVIMAVALILTVIFINGESLGIQKQETVMGYESKLFDTSKVHTIDIVMDDWDSFIETCTNEEYSLCSVVIDGEIYKNVAIRAKGNTSLTQVASYGNDRYSFKIEFDHYDDTKTYYGLDKLCLNNIIQDNTYMKDYLCYQLMGMFGVSSPLCSFVNISVNGETWGLYLAVEGVEEAFLERNYSGDYGELYKPDSSEMGGGRGNGKDFEMEQWSEEDSVSENENSDTTESTVDENTLQENTPPDMMENPFGNNTEFAPGQNGTGQEGQMMPPDMENSQGFEQSSEDSSISEDTQSFSDSQSDSFGGGQEFSGRGPGGFGGNMGGGGMGGSMGSDDVSLIYTDDNYDSYSNIFDNAKTDITDEDKDRLIQALKNINENNDIENSVDVDEVIRYFVVHNFVSNFDSYTGSMIHNYYLYESDGQLSMIPWDYNLAFGGFQSAADATSLVNYPIDSPVSGGTIDSRPMLAWIFSNEEYTQMYHEYFNEFITEVFDRGVFSEMIDSVKELISPYVEADHTKFCTYDEFLTGIDTLKEFCLLRAESISGQLDGTIGSTSEEQQDKENFVDASDISISDMGSMNNSMGGGRGGMMNNDFSGEGGDFSMREQQPSSEDSSSNMQVSNTADINSSEETNEIPPTEIPTESGTGE